MNKTEAMRQDCEPVAWNDGTLTLREDFAELLGWKGAIVREGGAIPAAWKPILYTSPQPLRDLSREEVMKLWDATFGSEGDTEFLERFAKLVRSAK